GVRSVNVSIPSSFMGAPPRARSVRSSECITRAGMAVGRRIVLLVHDETAVDAEGLPGHVPGARPGEECDDVRHVLRPPPAPQRHRGPAMPGELFRRHAEEGALLL